MISPKKSVSLNKVLFYFLDLRTHYLFYFSAVVSLGNIEMNAYSLTHCHLTQVAGSEAGWVA